MDMDYVALQQAYWHCYDMLRNKDKRHPGLLRKRELISKAWDNANAELLLRYILYDCQIESIRTNKDLLDFINNYKQTHNIKNSELVTELFDNLPPEFTKVTIDKLISACLDALDAFDRRLISDKFIISLGIWLTAKEKKELTEYDENGNFRNRKDVIKDRLFLSNANIWFNSKGLSYSEFRSLIKIEGRPKYSTLPTETLRLLTKKLLLLLDQDLDYHIDVWTDLEDKVKKVALQKNFTLKERVY